MPSPLPRSPLRLNKIDYKDTGNGAGKLTVAGIALPGKELYLFLDDQPLAKAVPDDGGKWSIESQMTLEHGPAHFARGPIRRRHQHVGGACHGLDRARQARLGGVRRRSLPPKAATP